MTREIIFGILSLILWALILVVTIKYVVILLRADNNGEGGTLTLVALAQRALGHGRAAAAWCCCSASSGAGLFYGDAMITPAISVLSAVEGLKLATPALDRLRRADRLADPDRPVHGPEPRHRQGRGLLRAGHGAVVRDPGAHRRLSTSPTIPACCGAINPAYGG